MVEETEKKEAVEGAFFTSLKRSNKQIRDDRAKTLSEDAQLIYRREVEDLEVYIRRMSMELEGMLDLSPENAFGLVLGKNFDAPKFVTKDIELGVKIRNAEIKLNIARKRYNYLFGGGK